LVKVSSVEVSSQLYTNGGGVSIAVGDDGLPTSIGEDDGGHGAKHQCGAFCIHFWPPRRKIEVEEE
jgi:hypothetical protein